MKKEIAVVGRKWDSSRPIFFAVPEGLTLSSIVLSSIERAYRQKEYSKAQYESLLKYARCRVDGVEVKREAWDSYLPRSGARIEILHGVRGGGGGGGGKNPIATILSAIVVVVAAVATWYVGGIGGISAAAALGAKFAIGVAAAGALYAINALFPAPTPSVGDVGLGASGSRDNEKVSPTYSITGGRNSANVNGYVPLILGKTRFTPPLGGRSWTSWEGDKQYFHMLVIWGHSDVSVWDFRIGETPLGYFKYVDHRFHQATTGNDMAFFSVSRNEQSIGATLKNSEGWSTRNIGEAESISLDFAFPRGLIEIDNTTQYPASIPSWAIDRRRSRTVEVQVMYKKRSETEWSGFGTVGKQYFQGGTVSGQCGLIYVCFDPNKNAFYLDDDNGKGTRVWVNWPPQTGGTYFTNIFYGRITKVRCFVDNGNPIIHARFEEASGRYQADTRMNASQFMKVFANKTGGPSWGSGSWQIYPLKNDTIITGGSVRVTSFDGVNATVEVSSGYISSSGYYRFTATTQSVFARSIRMDGLERAEYDVRCRRVSADTDSMYIMDEIQWANARAILNQPAFLSPVTLCCSELRIRASEQLSSYVDDFNAMCMSNIPDWNGSTWAIKNTANPASLMRYLLTSRHCLSNPYSEDRLDNAKLVEFWHYCNENEYEYNRVCDSEQALWARLIEVVAPGRAAPTTDVDGLWGVVIDRNGKKPVQMFTPRNSWGMSVQRTFADLPHALRVSFIDETQDYEQRQAYVYNDGYSADGANNTQKAQDIIEWEFPGITKWEKIWKQGRLYLARALHRQITIKINTDWEWLTCHRGDLVGVSSDVLMNVFGTARIMCLVYDVNGQQVIASQYERIPLDENGNQMIPIGVQLDDSISYDEPSPARYGIAIRSETGALTTHELEPEYGEERSILFFKNPLNKATVPPLGALCSVSLLGKEYDEYLVAAISPQDDTSCEMTLIQYKMDEIEAAMSGDIPPYEESVIMGIVRARRLPTPLIRAIRSDESVLGGTTGNSIPRIAVWWSMPDTSLDVTDLYFQIVVTDVETEEQIYGSAPQQNGFVYVEGVRELRVYTVRLRALNAKTGMTSEWSVPISHVCIGRTTPPPPPSAVTISGGVLTIVQNDRPQDLIGHVISIVMDERDVLGMGLELGITTDLTFDITPWASHSRRVFVQSYDELGLRSEKAVSLAINVGIDDFARDNVIFSYSHLANHWPGDIVGGYIDYQDQSRLKSKTTNRAWEETESPAAWSSNSSAYGWSLTETEEAWGVDTTYLAWSEDASYPAWNEDGAVEMSYTFSMLFPEKYVGGRIYIEENKVQGKLLSILYSVDIEQDAWSYVPSDDAWSSDPNSDGWASPIKGDWAVFPDNFVLSARQLLTFKLTYDASMQAILNDILVTIDVPDKEYVVEDLVVSEDGTTRIPVPAKYFRAITGVQITIQYYEDQNAMWAARIPGSEVMDEDGMFVLQGPYVVALDVDRRRTTANADLYIKGF